MIAIVEVCDGRVTAITAKTPVYRSLTRLAGTVGRDYNKTCSTPNNVILLTVSVNQ